MATRSDGALSATSIWGRTWSKKVGRFSSRASPTTTTWCRSWPRLTGQDSGAPTSTRPHSSTTPIERRSLHAVLKTIPAPLPATFIVHALYAAATANAAGQARGHASGGTSGVLGAAWCHRTAGHHGRGGWLDEGRVERHDSAGATGNDPHHQSQRQRRVRHTGPAEVPGCCQP